MRCDKYNVDEDGSAEFGVACMIASKMVKCEGRMMKGKEKRGVIAACTVVFYKRSCGKCAEQW